MTQPWPDAEDLLLLLAEHTGPRRSCGTAGSSSRRRLVPTPVGPGPAVYPHRAGPGGGTAARVHDLAPARHVERGARLGGDADLRSTVPGLRLTMPAKERMALTDALTSGEVDSVDELALRLSPYLEMAG